MVQPYAGFVQQDISDNVRYPRYRRRGWIGVDLDGTLARLEKGRHIGRPVAPMMARVKYWIGSGREVRIFTSRADDPLEVARIKDWLAQHGLPDLEVTNKKDNRMVALWDDRAVKVIENQGIPVFPSKRTSPRSILSRFMARFVRIPEKRRIR